MATKVVRNISRKCCSRGPSLFNPEHQTIYCNNKDSPVTWPCFSIRQLHVGSRTKQLPLATSAYDHSEREPANAADTRPETSSGIVPKDYKLFSRSNIPQVFRQKLSPGSHVDTRLYMAAAAVLPMRSNNYVCDELIDWSNIPDDPIFQLTFPQPGMLAEEDLLTVDALLQKNVNRQVLREAVENIRQGLNPHPAGQKELNVPKVNGTPIPGVQHKYRETLLFFPAEGQYCQAFCTYCFRWAQFTAVGSDQAFQSTDVGLLLSYLKHHKCISDVLFTGGDPMVMRANQWARYLLPLIRHPDLDHVATIRIGSKSLAYWPYRFVTDRDADDTLRLFEEVVRSGRHLAFMAHFSHPRELETPVVQEAIRRLRMTGAQIRSQAPLINHVNADPQCWTSMWRTQVRLGVVPYYMFVERDTGAKHYFEVPLATAVSIYNTAVTAVSGVARTVRGPSMSATPGKVHVVGTATVGGEKVFVLKFLQARNPEWLNNIFFAKFDPQVSWLDGLRPAFGEEKFFYEDEMEQIAGCETSSGVLFPYKEGFEYQNAVL